MGSAVGWIGQIFEFLLSLIPHLTIVRATHGGVKFVRGRRVVELAPGLHWYWPTVTEVVTYPTARQTSNLSYQCLVTRDGHTVVASGVVVYEVVDIKAALAKSYEVDSTVSDLAMAAIKNVIVTSDLDAMISGQQEIDELLGTEILDRLEPFGICVQNAYLTDFAPCVVVKTVGSDAVTYLPQDAPAG